jgi:hypothetical protein
MKYTTVPTCALLGCFVTAMGPTPGPSDIPHACEERYAPQGPNLKSLSFARNGASTMSYIATTIPS